MHIPHGRLEAVHNLAKAILDNPDCARYCQGGLPLDVFEFERTVSSENSPALQAAKLELGRCFGQLGKGGQDNHDNFANELRLGLVEWCKACEPTRGPLTPEEHDFAASAAQHFVSSMVRNSIGELRLLLIVLMVGVTSVLAAQY